MRISDWSSDVCSSDLPAIGVVPGRNARPLGRPRCGDRRAMDARVDRGDQPVLPRQPIDLPDAESDATRRQQQRQRRKKPPPHGTWFMYLGLGLLLVLSWCMNYSDHWRMSTEQSVSNSK